MSALPCRHCRVGTTPTSGTTACRALPLCRHCPCVGTAPVSALSYIGRFPYAGAAPYVGAPVSGVDLRPGTGLCRHGPHVGGVGLSPSVTPAILARRVLAIYRWCIAIEN